MLLQGTYKLNFDIDFICFFEFQKVREYVNEVIHESLAIVDPEYLSRLDTENLETSGDSADFHFGRYNLPASSENYVCITIFVLLWH